MANCKSMENKIDLVKPIAKGNTACIYLCDGKAVKVFSDSLSDDNAEHEAEKQKIAHDCGLPVPKVFEVCRIGKKKAIVMEYVKGTAFGDLIQKDFKKMEHYLSVCVELQIKMHSKSVKGLENMKDRINRQIKKADILSKEYKKALLEKLEELPSDTRLCHGDYHPFNIIKCRDKAVIIDWMDATAGNPCADVYRSYLLCAQVSTELADRYCEIYCSKSGMPRSDIFNWAEVIAGARLSEKVSSEGAGILLDIVHEGIEKEHIKKRR